MGALDNLFFPRIDVDGERVIDSPRAFNFIGAQVTDDPVNGRANIAIGGSSLSTFPRQTVEADTVALFTGNNTTADLSPNNFSLIANTGSVRYTKLFPDYTAFYVRSSDRLRSVTPNSAMALTGAMTVEFIVQFPTGISGSSANRVIFHGTDTSAAIANNIAWSLELSGVTSDVLWLQENGAGVDSFYLSIGTVVPYFPACYVACTRTAGQVVQVYFQGLPAIAASPALVAPVVGANGQLFIGGASHTDFAIADIRISNTAHTAAQIKATYNATLGLVLGQQP